MSDEKCEVEGKAERDIAPGLSMAEAAKLSKIFKLNVVCFEDLFDRLSLKELFTLRTTCKRMKQDVDYYIRINFPAVKFGCGKMRIWYSFDEFRNLGVDDIKMIKEVDFWWPDPIEPEIFVQLEDVLAQAESIWFALPWINGELHDVFLKFCDNLKILYINGIVGTGQDWLLRQYPTLEHIVLDERAHPDEVIELKTFFELNPNIRIFSTSLHFLWENRFWMIGSNITFERLDVYIFHPSRYDMSRRYGLLKELHEQGFYQRLHFYGHDIESTKDIDQISSLNIPKKLFLSLIFKDYSIPPLPSLEELCFKRGSDIKNANAWAGDLIRVERIRVGPRSASLTDIMPFISHSKNVEKIQIESLKDGDYFKNGIVDLRSLNEVREQLVGAKKVIIYVEEYIYLKTKWRNMRTSFPLIELKRAQSLEKRFQFSTTHFLRI